MSDAEANPRQQEGEQPGQGEQIAAAFAASANQSQPREPKPLDMFHVVLHDDDEHSYEYVIKMMQQLFACDFEIAFERAKVVSEEGRVICATVHKELAELKRDQIHAFGPDRRIASCKGAMSASVEPAA